MVSLYTAYNNFASASAGWDPDQPFDNAVDEWEKRMRPVRDYIPDDVAQLGYVADWDLPNSVTDPVDQDTEFVLTQYALAPRIVQPGLEHEWIIGNFLDPNFKAWLDRSSPSYEIRSFGYGIYVIHRTSP